jgi:hypothetical protein
MFEKITKPTSTRIAFLPHTLKLKQTPYHGNQTLTQFTIAAYWHEVKAGKPVVAFGFYFFDVGDKTLAKLTELGRPIESVDYQQMLNLAHKEESNFRVQTDAIRVHGVVKFGHSKPFRAKNMYEYYYPEITGVYHDEQELVTMQANPNYIPVGADGWYTLNKKQAF